MCVNGNEDYPQSSQIPDGHSQQVVVALLVGLDCIKMLVVVLAKIAWELVEALLLQLQQYVGLL